ncbi:MULTISPECIES: VWA domain-containing protein [Comamonadaceae]|uniref:vWA domain-containing protein n=1 Tax=unclassified Acidovorax TaxID=2684926 RepID=UPI00234A08FD|nr:MULTISPECIES: VWA domain-containing protein [Comamonadaceae]WCM87475.1 VWA domain-containing protein [Acidovorax sp. NCPPB 3576]WOI45931.1 VWA domain-containing protein [Paracidovorax avenae]GKS87949.1 VWA domain-containing protein [Acidovorax sp. SUPP2539]GKS93084.1 VWA domain-containing protein [Acidovorax sp. SUPP2825]
MTPLTIPDPLQRWRLLLGEPAEPACGALGDAAQAADAALEWLYGRDSDRAERGERSAGLGPSALSTPDWINTIHTLFPKEVIERLERDAVERYGIDEVVTNLEVLERIEPSESLLRAVLHTKHLMNPQVLAAARRLVAEVVRRIMEKLATEVRQAFSGSRDRRRLSRMKVARNFDFRRTLQANLRRWDAARGKLYVERPIFISRTRRHAEPWDIVLLIDQSGSMVDSVIHSAVMAACLWQLPGMRTRLVAFDTQVVDLTADVSDPVELLMKVQLGGGTDIARAVAYAQSLVANPARTIVVLVSDFYEGGDPGELVRRVKALTGAGAKVLGLAALDAQAEPAYDREMAARLVKEGAQVGAMTPGQLAGWLAEKVQA